MQFTQLIIMCNDVQCAHKFIFITVVCALRATMALPRKFASIITSYALSGTRSERSIEKRLAIQNLTINTRMFPANGISAIKCRFIWANRARALVVSKQIAYGASLWWANDKEIAFSWIMKMERMRQRERGREREWARKRSR